MPTGAQIQADPYGSLTKPKGWNAFNKKWSGKMTEETKNKPLTTFRASGIEVGVWPNDKGGHSFNIKKSYRDKDSGEWNESKTFFKNDLLVLAELLRMAYAYSITLPNE